MKSVYVQATREGCLARRQRALDSISCTVGELNRRMEDGTATPDEREAWNEIDSMDFLLNDLDE